MSMNHPCIKDNLIFRQVDDDFVVYDPDTDQTACLNLEAAAVLDLCDGTNSREDMVAWLCRETGGDSAQIGEAVDQILATFRHYCFLLTTGSDP